MYFKYQKLKSSLCWKMNQGGCFIGMYLWPYGQEIRINAFILHKVTCEYWFETFKTEILAQIYPSDKCSGEKGQCYHLKCGQGKEENIKELK